MCRPQLRKWIKSRGPALEAEVSNFEEAGVEIPVEEEVMGHGGEGGEEWGRGLVAGSGDGGGGSVEVGVEDEWDGEEGAHGGAEVEVEGDGDYSEDEVVLLE